jgi:hypothetical protein
MQILQEREERTHSVCYKVKTGLRCATRCGEEGYIYKCKNNTEGYWQPLCAECGKGAWCVQHSSHIFASPRPCVKNTVNRDRSQYETSGMTQSLLVIWPCRQKTRVSQPWNRLAYTRPFENNLDSGTSEADTAARREMCNIVWIYLV